MSDTVTFPDPKMVQTVIDRLEKAKIGTRDLDGDVWWLISSDEHRAVFDPTGYIQSMITRDGLPSAGLSRFYNSRDTPPCKLDYAGPCTTNYDESVWWFRHSFPNWIIRRIEYKLKQAKNGSRKQGNELTIEVIHKRESIIIESTAHTPALALSQIMLYILLDHSGER